MIDYSQCRCMGFKIEERTPVNLREEEPEDVVRQVYIEIVQYEHEGVGKEIKLGEIHLRILDHDLCTESANQRAVGMVKGIFETLYEAMFEIEIGVYDYTKEDMQCMPRAELRAAMTDSDIEILKVVYITRIDLAELNEEESVLVLSRILGMFTESFDYGALIWDSRAPMKRVNLNAVKRTFTKIKMLYGGGILFVSEGGMKLPHHIREKRKQ